MGTIIIIKAIKMIPIIHIFLRFADLWCYTPDYNKFSASLTFDLALSTLSSIMFIFYPWALTSFPTSFCTFNAYYILPLISNNYFYFNWIICYWNKVYWFTSWSYI